MNRIIFGIIIRMLVSGGISFFCTNVLDDGNMPLGASFALFMFIFVWASWMHVLREWEDEELANDFIKGKRFGYRMTFLGTLLMPLVLLLIFAVGLPLLIGSLLNSEAISSLLTGIVVVAFAIFPIVYDVKQIITAKNNII